MADRLIEGYAGAIFEVARAEGVLEEVEDELFRFARLLEERHDLAAALTDIGLPAERRQALIEELLTGRATPQTTALISFVVGAGRARELPRVIERLLERAAEERKRALAEVRSAVPLDDEQRARLIEALARATGKTIELKVVVDPDVIGGISAKVGDEIIDGTVRARLQRFKEQIERRS